MLIENFSYIMKLKFSKKNYIYKYFLHHTIVYIDSNLEKENIMAKILIILTALSTLFIIKYAPKKHIPTKKLAVQVFVQMFKTENNFNIKTCDNILIDITTIGIDKNNKIMTLTGGIKNTNIYQISMLSRIKNIGVKDIFINIDTESSIMTATAQLYPNLQRKTEFFSYK